MKKKKRSEYTKQRERILKVYSRINKKGYKILEDTYLPTTKELLKEGTDPEEYAKYLKKLKTKDIKKGMKILDPETGIILKVEEIPEYEKEKKSVNNRASFYDWLKDILENVILPDGLPMLSGRVWVDGGILETEYERFKEAMFSQIDKDKKEDEIPEERKQDITTEVNRLTEVLYYEMFQESLAKLTNLILNRAMTPEESQFISDWGDFINGSTSI